MTPSPPTRLWHKDVALDEIVHRFTVGDDPAWDQHLVHWDCLGSVAHVQTLARARLLTDADRDALLVGLADIDARDRAGQFVIPPELEDCHTAIEADLVARCGAVGGRIHAGRSRNDQVATALRLFLRHFTLHWLARLHDFAAAALERIDRDGDIPMPGYTHMQAAMPSSIGLWLHAHVEAALEQMHAGLDLLRRLDACPLGTGAGYGVPLPLDRSYTAALLGFTRVQRNPLDVQNSRGRMELYFARVAADIAALVAKLACDLLLFSTAEFGFCSLPTEMTTGSSLMPHKRNPDVLELLRAHEARARARVLEIESITAKLPSGYHRDLQWTKPPAIRTALDTADILAVATRVLSGLEVHRDRLAAAMRPELYATHAALALVRQGMPFREAYRQIAADVTAGRFDARAAAQWHDGGGRLTAGLSSETRAELAQLRQQLDAWQTRVQAAEAALLPAPALQA
ncbi:MAG: argininosuccinate lyase [Phycisphaerae bacterium]|nr:argininosuccinate lyase [Phycisphaerae bacterium]